MTPLARRSFAALALLFVTSLPVLAAPVSITGQVTYRERMALPPEAALEVQLLDVSLADARATVHAAAQLSGPGQVPLTFTLNFDDKVINPKHSYALSARLTSGGRLAFLNTTRYSIDPLAPQQPILIVMDFVGGTEPAPAPVPAPADDGTTTMPQASIPAVTLLGTIWRATEIKGNPVPEKIRATLSIAEDGRAGGKAGCNNYFAQATFDGNKLSFGSPASTRMMCPEPVMQQETAFLGALTAVSGFAYDETTLKLLDDGGRTVMVLVRDH